MKKYEIKTKDNQTFYLETPEPHPTFKSCFAFGIYKGGSTLLFNLLTAICHQYNQIPYVSILDRLFIEGFDIRHLDPASVTSLLTQEGYCFGGFREFPSPWINEFLPDRKKIILLRDPRDILVSQYYSHKYSHQIPKNDSGGLQKSHSSSQYLSINEYVLKWNSNIKRKLDSYREINELDSVKLFRYEDVILSKKQWIKDICDFLGLSLNSNELQVILDKYDIIPTTENEKSHIRRVIPGDYLNKLNPEIIEQLNDYFKDFLVKYNYT